MTPHPLWERLDLSDKAFIFGMKWALLGVISLLAGLIAWEFATAIHELLAPFTWADVTPAVVAGLLVGCAVLRALYRLGRSIAEAYARHLTKRTALSPGPGPDRD